MEIIDIQPQHNALVRSMYHCYLHDLSEFDGPYHLDEQGNWQPDYLDYWLAGKPGALAHLIRHDDQYIGLAFSGAPPFPYMSDNRDFRFCEFFILRAYRQSGLGRRAALEVLKKYRGHWEMVVLPENQPALSFWRAIIADLDADRFRRATTDEGIVYSFMTPSPN